MLFQISKQHHGTSQRGTPPLPPHRGQLTLQEEYSHSESSCTMSSAVNSGALSSLEKIIPLETANVQGLCSSGNAAFAICGYFQAKRHSITMHNPK